MAEPTNLAFSADEMEILVDALEADLEDYSEAAKEAREEGDTDQATEFSGAAERVQAVLQKVRGASND